MEAKFKHLQVYLASLSSFENEVTLSFEKIEEIMKADLPPEARESSEWWSNTLVDADQHARAWLKSGWEVAAVAQKEGSERVRFKRINY